MDVLRPRESAKLICESSSHVTIDEEAVSQLSSFLVGQIRENPDQLNFKRWKQHPLNPKIADDNAVDWIFLVDALNFSFWSSENVEKYCVEFGGSRYTGYWSLCAAINRSLAEDIPVTSAEFCKDITLSQAEFLFRSDSKTNIPMLRERVDVMKEVGKVLIEKYDGKFVNCVKMAGNSAQNLLQIVVNDFPCFRDEAVFDDRKVSFYKRAQILIADIWACFEGEGLGMFSDIDSITMFADYRIPQILAYFKTLVYSDELLALLNTDYMFQSGDLMEMQIRAASIWAVELISERVNKQLESENNSSCLRVNAVTLDHFLWDYRRTHDDETKHVPFHKIRCIYY